MKLFEITFVWLFMILSVGLGIWTLYAWIRKKRDKKYNLATKIILSVGAVGCIVFAIPMFQDIPYLFSGEYMEIRGTVTQDQEDGGRHSWLLTTVYIKNDGTGKVERLEIGKSFLKKGDQAYVRYLPHSKHGSLINFQIDLE